MLKRTGRGHDPVRGALETQPGECALLCPACPHPGINLPVRWEDVPRESKYVIFHSLIGFLVQMFGLDTFTL